MDIERWFSQAVRDTISIKLNREAEADIIAAYRLADQMSGAEISGLGRVTVIIQDDRYVVEIPEIIIPRQTCGPFHTKFLGEEVAAAFEAIEREGGDPTAWQFWWHSHVHGSPHFSGIDDDMIERRVFVMLTSVHAHLRPSIPPITRAGPFFSLVGNVRGEMHVRCDFLSRKEIHDDKEEYRQHTIRVPLLRDLPSMPEEERRVLLLERARLLRPLIRNRVIFVERGDDDD